MKGEVLGSGPGKRHSAWEEEAVTKRPFAGAAFALHNPPPFATAPANGQSQGHHSDAVAADAAYANAVTAACLPPPQAPPTPPRASAMEEAVMDTAETPMDECYASPARATQPPQSPPVSPATMQGYVSSGNYSPRQVLSYCRPPMGAYGFHCPYPSDFY